MAPWILFSIVFFTILIYIWVKGVAVIRKVQPEKVVTFYFLMAAIRFLMSLTIVAFYMLFAQHTHDEAVWFCTIFSLMYVTMVTVSIILKH